MFVIEEAAATIRSINPRAENHGDEHVLGCDIGLNFAFSNKKLALLDEALLPLLYQREQSDEGDCQDALDLEEGFLPHLRFPLLGKLSWDYKGAGYTFRLIKDGIKDEPDVIEIQDCKLNDFKIDCFEGGSINLSVRIQGNPSEETIGELCHYIKDEVSVSLIPPKRDDDQKGLPGTSESQEAA